MSAPYRIHALAVTESTNDDARQAAASGEAEGYTVWAWEQKQGRGRQGRVWHSPPGNLYASILLRPSCDARHAAHYAFVAALAIYDVVKGYLPNANVALKWPNDVLVGGKKISGVLLESSIAPGGKLEWLVAGIGINVEHHPDDTPFPATSLRQEGVRGADLEAMIQQLCARFFHWKETLEKQGFSALRTAWLAHAQKGGLSARLPDRTIEGEFADLDPDGNLILQLADGSKQAIAAGDVWFSG